MYKVELDFVLRFVPPMAEERGGVVLTRSIELPFPPSSEIHLFSRHMDDCVDLGGFKVEHIVWDLDRKVFLADTSMVNQDLPIAAIPDIVRSWMDLGWRLGSYADAYEDPGGEDEDDGPTSAASPSGPDLTETMHQTASAGRPRSFNQLMKALVRNMAETYSNIDIAYAMDKTGWYFSDQDLDRPAGSPTKEWEAARDEYSKLSSEARFTWWESVRQYPGFSEVMRVRRPGRRNSR